SERAQRGAVLIERREGVSAVEIAPVQIVELLVLELNPAFDRVLFERDRQVILVFNAVAVAEIRAAWRTAAAERISHVDGQAYRVRLLIAAFALILQTSLMDHFRVDDPGLGHPQGVVIIFAARSAFCQHIVAGTAATAEAATAAAATAAATTTAEAEAEAAAEAGSELGIRDFAGAVVVIDIERVALVDQIIQARAGIRVDGCAGHVGPELHPHKIRVKRSDYGRAASVLGRSVGEERC